MAESLADPGERAAPAGQGSRPDAAEVDALVDLVRLRHAGPGAAELAYIRESVALSRQTAAALRAHPLLNADEPDPVFAAYRID